MKYFIIIINTICEIMFLSDNNNPRKERKYFETKLEIAFPRHVFTI